MSRMRMPLLAVCGATLVFAAPAVAVRPAAGGHYFGLPEVVEGPSEGYAPASAALRVSRSRHRVASATLTFYCGGDADGVRVHLAAAPRGREAPVAADPHR